MMLEPADPAAAARHRLKHAVAVREAAVEGIDPAGRAIDENADTPGLRSSRSEPASCPRSARRKATRSDEALERERPVRAAEAERVRNRDFEASLASLVRRVVEIALGIRLGQIDRRRNDLI